MEQAGVPDGVINVVPGFGHTAGAAVSAHMDIDMVSFQAKDLYEHQRRNSDSMFWMFSRWVLRVLQKLDA